MTEHLSLAVWNVGDWRFSQMGQKARFTPTNVAANVGERLENSDGEVLQLSEDEERDDYFIAQDELGRTIARGNAGSIANWLSRHGYEARYAKAVRPRGGMGDWRADSVVKTIKLQDWIDDGQAEILNAILNNRLTLEQISMETRYGVAGTAQDLSLLREGGLVMQTGDGRWQATAKGKHLLYTQGYNKAINNSPRVRGSDKQLIMEFMSDGQRHSLDEVMRDLDMSNNRETIDYMTKLLGELTREGKLQAAGYGMGRDEWQMKSLPELIAAELRRELKASAGSIRRFQDQIQTIHDQLIDVAQIEGTDAGQAAVMVRASEDLANALSKLRRLA